MKYTIPLLLSLLFLTNSFAESQEEVVQDAWMLYYSERASWLGTDIFLANYSEKKAETGGYFSYSEAGQHRCIFYNKETPPKVLVEFTFDDSFDTEKVEIKTANRNLSEHEQVLYEIRTIALEEINQDTLFKQYTNVTFNPIPVITKKERKVYVLSGTTKHGIVIFGNDYLISFNRKNKVKSKKALHNNIIPIEYGREQDSTKKQISGFHTHLASTGSLITATDICTIMLYQDFTDWERYYVTSAKEVSIWDCKKKHLLVMSRKAWDKINEHQKE